MKLNLGCGRDTMEGYVNLDRANLHGVNVVHDVAKLPLPFKDNEFDEIYAKDIIEHVPDYISLLKDLHRIMKPGARLIIKSPHYTSTNFFSDPTHAHAYAVRTFSFFCRENPNFKWEQRDYYFDFSFSKLESVKITFPRHFSIISKIFGLVINAHPKTQLLYELTLLRALLPAENVEAVLIK